MKHINSCEKNELNTDNGNYTLYHTKFIAGVFVVCAYGFLGLAYFIQSVGYGIISFLYVSPFTIFCVWMAAIAIKWKIEVKGDHITTYYPLKKPYSFTFQDISRVKHGLYLVVYTDKKRVFSMDHLAIGYFRMYKQLRELGKMDGYQDINNFSNKPSIPAFIWLITMTIGFTLLSIGLAIEERTVSIPVVLLAIFAFALLYLSILLIRYRRKVIGKNILIRHAFSEKNYSFTEISKVKISTGDGGFKVMHIYVDNKRITSIADSDAGYITWIKKLKSEGVTIDST
ncbi:MAG: hypothetical protein LBC73_04860 [Oscillospiraceae bacterium]|jgi:hypothetical protein|nr:hypothetical protein [Oscillospiraceae bacterium]